MTMQADAPAKTRATYGYYRQPNGDITASPSTNTDELAYRRSGWTPLPQYGSFEMSTPYMASHPLEPLFMRGGAGELTADQVIKQGLSLNPPMVPACKMPLGQDHKHHTYACMANARPVVFPQIAGRTDLGPFRCQMGCDREFPTVEAQRQHESVMHQAEKSDQRTGESLAAALTAGLQQGFGGVGAVVAPTPAAGGASRHADPDEVQELREQIETLKAMIGAGAAVGNGPKRGGGGPRTGACDLCEKPFTAANAGGLASMIRKHKNEYHT